MRTMPIKEYVAYTTFHFSFLMGFMQFYLSEKNIYLSEKMDELYFSSECIADNIFQTQYV